VLGTRLTMLRVLAWLRPRRPAVGAPGVQRRAVSEMPCGSDTRPTPRVSTAAPGAVLTAGSTCSTPWP